MTDPQDTISDEHFTDDAPEAEQDNTPPPDDGKPEHALTFVRSLLMHAGINAHVEVMNNNARQIELEITGPDSSTLIGKRGSTLFALQFLINRVINRGPTGRRYVVLDVDGYRARREHGLAQVAVKLGEQAMREGKIITFDPMSARERRVIHLALARFPGIRTQSEGEGGGRRVQIIPTRVRTR